MLHGNGQPFGTLPRDGYGFNFQQAEKEESEEDSTSSRLVQRFLPGETVKLASGGVYTHSFMIGDFEYDSVRILGGQTYRGDDSSSEENVVGRIGAALFTLGHREGLYEPADALTQETHEATTTLFTDDGKPIKGFKKMCRNKRGFINLLYITGVFVTTEHKGRGLGLDLVRSLIYTLQNEEDHWPDIVVLCPAGDPPRGTWEGAFQRLVTLFSKLGFRRCGSVNKSGTDQGMYMFLESGEFLPPEVLGGTEVSEGTTTPEVLGGTEVSEGITAPPPSTENPRKRQQDETEDSAPDKENKKQRAH